MNNYGAANRYAFDDPNKWFTVKDVPLLDEHTMTSESGKPVADVDRAVLQQIADNNNRRVVETGDPATLILGHTSDDPRAEEKPAKGFVVNYRVLPFKRDPRTGQVIYAIHGDFKVRPQNAQLLEEYPRRSVELWWNKKELDPIALLGGTSPERDLGVTVREGPGDREEIDIKIDNGGVSEEIDIVMKKARIKHLALLGATAPERDLGQTIRFHRHGNDTIEDYQIDHVLSPRKRFSKGDEKVHKVMKEFKEGELHSGSKKGPKVTSRDQAIAIAMNEAGKPKKMSHEEHTMPLDGKGMGSPKGYPQERTKYMGEGCKFEYADDGMETDDLGDYDPGEDALQPEDANDPADEDPVVAKVFQSKRMKDMEDKLNQILQAVQSVAGEEPGTDGRLPPEEGVGGGTEEMPPPAAGPMGAGGPPPMGGEGEEGYPEEEEPEEDAAIDHGARPVKMNSTGYPGLGNTNIAGFNTVPENDRPRATSFSRRREATTTNGDSRMPSKNLTPEQKRIAVLEKQAQDNIILFGRMVADREIENLIHSGTLFGENPQDEAEGRQIETDRLVHIYKFARTPKSDGGEGKSHEEAEEEVKFEAGYIRKRFARRAGNPANPAFPGVARYARSVVTPGGPEEDPEDYEPRSPKEASDLADLIYYKKMSRADAVKLCKKKDYAPFDVTTGH